MSSCVVDEEYLRLRAAGYQGWGGETCGARLSGWRATLDRFGARLALDSGPARVLEIGCGNGLVAQEIAQRGHEVTGVDVSPAAVAWARSNFVVRGLAGAFMVGDACALALNDDVFDLVIDGNCLHCIVGRDREQALGEGLRVLKRGGRFLVSSMCGPPRSRRRDDDYDPSRRCLMRDGRPWRFMPSAEALIQECCAAGFEVIDLELKRNSWWDHLDLLLHRPAVPERSQVTEAADAATAYA